MGSRRTAREVVIKKLYAYEISKGGDNPSEELLIEDCSKFDKKARIFADALYEGIQKHVSEIDSIIKTYADNWEIERMAALDKNILRTAIYEMKYMENIPPVVSINEAIDMAKKYSTRDSGKFVNGILDKIHKKLILQEKNP